MTEIKTTYIIPGLPVAKPRMTRRDKWAQRDCVVRYRAWSDLVRLVCKRIPPAETVERIDWIAYFAPPQSWSKSKRMAAMGELHRSKPDRDNLDKGVLDSLYPAGDSAIACGTIEKRWGEVERLEITITYREGE